MMVLLQHYTLQENLYQNTKFEHVNSDIHDMLKKPNGRKVHEFEFCID